MSEYIEFKLAKKQNPKTEVWDVVSKHHGYILGIIKWYALWRQYCFFPSPVTVYNSGCLSAIMSFISDLNNARKKRGRSLDH